MKKIIAIMSLLSSICTFVAMGPYAFRSLKNTHFPPEQESEYVDPNAGVEFDDPDLLDDIFGDDGETGETPDEIPETPEEGTEIPDEGTETPDEGTETPDDGTEEPDKQEPPEEEGFKFVTSDASWFKNTLFIGDSRTDGLRLYGKIKGADFFCGTSATVRKLAANKYTVNGESILLVDLLAKKKYDKIYLMVGINELGGHIPSITADYKKLVNKIRQLQPDALIFVQANMYLTKARSDKNIYKLNNANVDKFNTEIAKLADWEKTFYIDMNEYFGDGNGNLSSTYCTDGVHLLAKYYKEWASWILTKTVPDKNS